MENLTNNETSEVSDFVASVTKVKKLLAQNTFIAKDIENLSHVEQGYLSESITTSLQQLTGTERDDFIEKIEPLISANTKSDIWDYNHAMINQAISDFISQYSVMPSRSIIAEKTGLSRQTVGKHLKAYKTHPQFAAEMEQFKFMVPQVLSNIYKFALKGNMHAARLYLETVGAVKQQGIAFANAQNNFIQINNTVLSQENLKALTKEQLNQLERIITNPAANLMA